MTATLKAFVATIASPRQAKRALEALEQSVRYNGQARLLPRYALIEDNVRRDYVIAERKGKPIFQGPEGQWLDERNITRTGMAYAAYLLATTPIRA